MRVTTRLRVNVAMRKLAKQAGDPFIYATRHARWLDEHLMIRAYERWDGSLAEIRAMRDESDAARQRVGLQ